MLGLGFGSCWDQVGLDLGQNSGWGQDFIWLVILVGLGLGRVKIRRGVGFRLELDWFSVWFGLGLGLGFRSGLCSATDEVGGGL